jgi:hypothetical protein
MPWSRVSISDKRSSPLATRPMAQMALRGKGGDRPRPWPLSRLRPPRSRAAPEHPTAHRHERAQERTGIVCRHREQFARFHDHGISCEILHRALHLPHGAW